MSLDATVWAWKKRIEQNPHISRSAVKIVLVSLADRASEDHTCYPSIARLEADTELNRKTILNALKHLENLGLICDTGRRMGKTKKVKVYELVGVVGREDGLHPKSARNSTKKGPILNDPKNGTIHENEGNALLNDTENGSIQDKQAQIWNDSKKGMIPNLPANSPKYGSDKQSQIWDSELPSIELPKEPLCASVPEVAAGSKPDASDAVEPDNPDAWKSAKGKTLTPSQQKIFGQLWEAFDYKKGRAAAIDEFLKHLMPWFGKDKEFNRKNLQTLLDAIAKHVATRNLPGNTSTPLYFERWISKRRWEDDYPLTGKMSTSMCDMSPKAVGERRRPLWEIQGFDSFDHWQEYQNLCSDIANLQGLKKLTLGQQSLLEEWQEKKVLITPKNKKQVAA